MNSERYGELIEVLDCDIGVRPQAAPGVDQLMPYARGSLRIDGALLVEFEEQAAAMLESFVAAERLCCADIGWAVERQPVLRLRITATDTQINAIESLWNSK